MRPVKKSREWNFGPLCLYMDDVKRILAVMEKEYPKPRVIVGEHVLENTAELGTVAAIKEQVHNLDVTGEPKKWGEGTSVRLMLRPNMAYLTVDDDADTIGMGVATKIVSVLSSRRRRLKGLVASKGMYVLLAPFVTFPLAATVALLWVGALGWAVIAALAFVTSIGWCYYAYIVSERQFCVIVLKPSGEVEGFFAKHRDQLIMNLITAVLAGVVGLILGRISCDKIVERPGARNEGGQLPAVTEKEGPSGTLPNVGR